MWSFVVATALALLIAGCIGRFTRRMAAPGGLYSLTAKGLNPGAAFACGMALLVGYGLLAAAALAGAAGYLEALVDPARRAPAARRLTIPAVLLVGGAGGRARAARGAAVGPGGAADRERGDHADGRGLRAAADQRPPAGEPVPARRPGLGGIAAGVLPALAAFIGFEVATALGAEARRPFRSVPRAVTATAATSGVLYLFAAQTQVVGFATTARRAGRAARAGAHPGRRPGLGLDPAAARPRA